MIMNTKATLVNLTNFGVLKLCTSGRVLSFHEESLKTVLIDANRRWIPDNWKWDFDSRGCPINQMYGKAVRYSESSSSRPCLFQFIETRWAHIDGRIEKDRAKVARRWSKYREL